MKLVVMVVLRPVARSTCGGVRNVLNGPPKARRGGQNLGKTSKKMGKGAKKRDL